MKTLKEFTNENLNAKELLTTEELSGLMGGLCWGGSCTAGSCTFGSCTAGSCTLGQGTCSSSASCDVITFGLNFSK